MARPWQLLRLMVAAATMAGEMAAVAQCPAGYETHPLILMSLDGFRADYLDRGLTPSLRALADRGVHATYMIPSYPTLTFPNHYTIVTGLNPESHGIIANKFFDPEFYATFEVGSDEALKPRWWLGEPIWNTVTDQGKKSATFFWPGSDVAINGKYPTYWIPYNWTIPFEERVDQVLEWVSLPEDERPVWMSLYLNQPDHETHTYGPDSVEVNSELEYLDLIVDRLVQGLAVRGLTDCVNLMVVADHGAAAAAAQDNVIKLVDYIPNLYDLAYAYVGVFARLDPKDDSQAGEEAVTSPLSCAREGLRVYLREELPTRLHFSNNRRIEDVVLDVDPGLTVSISYDFDDLGFHGYDNYFASMDALFVGVGPDFRQQVVVDDFHNTELYNLMCTLVGIEPSPNNGTLDSLRHFLRDPPPPPSLPQEDRPPTSQFPSGDLTPLLNMSQCSGDLSAPEDWLSALNLTQTQQEEAEDRHLPWGIPLSGSLPASLTLLHHTDHVTGYSESLEMPLWTSLSIESSRVGSPAPQQWSSDVRLQPSTTQTCPSYLSLQSFNVSMYPLFPPAYSEDPSLERVPYLASNGVPVSSYLESRWGDLVDEMVPQWQQLNGPLNLVLGPVFDNNADSFPDNFTNFSTPEVPSDLFMVVTRCLDSGLTSIDLCPSTRLDSQAFIFPQTQFVTNCLTRERYAREYSAKVSDVETATGLTFFPDIDYTNRTSLVLRIHQDIWPLSLQ